MFKSPDKKANMRSNKRQLIKSYEAESYVFMQYTAIQWDISTYIVRYRYQFQVYFPDKVQTINMNDMDNMDNNSKSAWHSYSS